MRNVTTDFKRNVVILTAALSLTSCFPFASPPTPRDPSNLSPAANISGYRRVTGPMQLSFPVDHGPHPEYLTEWWYLTGNLETDTHRHFGYQLTFFRRALSPSNDTFLRESEWASNQVYMAHFALTDVEANSYQASERFERGAAGLAGSSSEPFTVWLADWQITEVSDRKFTVSASDNIYSINISLESLKEPVLHGNLGYSQKGPDPGNASTYYSLSRLETSGRLIINGRSFLVDGHSWMDHEFSTSALAADQVGWDWFSIQLDDGTELMLFHLRRSDGSIDPYSSGTLVDASGRTKQLSSGDFTISVLASWQSPHSDASYPARWELTIPSEEIHLQIAPFVADQELNLAFTYWEGAVQVSGNVGNAKVSGVGYVELTGYAERFSGDF